MSPVRIRRDSFPDGFCLRTREGWMGVLKMLLSVFCVTPSLMIPPSMASTPPLEARLFGPVECCFSPLRIVQKITSGCNIAEIPTACSDSGCAGSGFPYPAEIVNSVKQSPRLKLPPPPAPMRG